MARRPGPAGASSDRDELFARKPTNPFFSDQDDANEAGSSRSNQLRRSGTMPTAGGSNRHYDTSGGYNDDGAQDGQLDDDLMTQIQASRTRQLDSTRKALQSMYESEQIGVATAEELNRQGEKLNNVEAKLDSMNNTLTQTQRHLNNIKSVFGGIVNWWSKPRDSVVTQGQAGRGPAAPVNRNAAANNGNMPKSKSEYSGFFAADASASSDPHEQEVNQNLSEMSMGLGRLKSLAEGLNVELERQNAQIDRTVKKADVVKPRLDDQNRQMRQILGQK